MPLKFYLNSLSLSLSPHHNPWQVQHRKLQASKVLSNYQCSLFPCEMRSVWDDNMGIHYSLELEASCRSMVRTYQKPNTGYFCTHQAWRPSTTSSWEGASGWPCLLTSLSYHYLALLSAVEAGLLVKRVRMIWHWWIFNSTLQCYY